MQAGDVAILREQDVPSLAPELNAALGDGECISRLLATNDERDATDVALGRCAQPSDTIWRRRLLRQRFVSNDSCPIRKISPGLSSVWTSRANFR